MMNFCWFQLIVDEFVLNECFIARLHFPPTYFFFVLCHKIGFFCLSFKWRFNAKDIFCLVSPSRSNAAYFIVNGSDWSLIYFCLLFICKCGCDFELSLVDDDIDSLEEHLLYFFHRFTDCELSWPFLSEVLL